MEVMFEYELLSCLLSFCCYSFTIADLSSKGEFVVSLNIAVCFGEGNCVIDVPILTYANLPKPLCKLDTLFLVEGDCIIYSYSTKFQYAIHAGFVGIHIEVTVLYLKVFSSFHSVK